MYHTIEMSPETSREQFHTKALLIGIAVGLGVALLGGSSPAVYSFVQTAPARSIVQSRPSFTLPTGSSLHAVQQPLEAQHYSGQTLAPMPPIGQASVSLAPVGAFFAGCLVAIAGLALHMLPGPQKPLQREFTALAAIGGTEELTEVPAVIGMNPDPNSLHRRMEAMLRAGQEKVCKAIEECDGQAKFQSDAWIRAGTEAAGGGGISRVLANGKIWEKAGVNLSVVWGQMPQEALPAATEKAAEYIKKMGLKPGERVPFFVAALSCVMHPRNPHCPTMHFNYRYFELDADNWWFGGGTDITPAYLDEEDMKHFHGTYKKICDKYDKDFYRKFKKWADEYFVIKHRGETRGLGGIFFDDLNDRDPDTIFKFCEECLDNVTSAYVPIIEKHKDDTFTEEQKRWQLIRRGRYAEFNLIYDRGTLFGLKAGGRIESILMTIPETARWEYAHKPEPGSEEDKILQLFRAPRDFV